nr:hypothetical protein [Gammaproteobacteria bacterium]
MIRSLKRLSFTLMMSWTFGLSAEAPQQTDWSLDRLMQSISGIESRTNRFTETKDLAILDISLTQQGRLHFQSPDR